MRNPGTPDNPLRVAIVGSGPAGFYAAEALIQSAAAVRVDMFEHLPSPFGLVRYGVAPDHSKLKQPIRVYQEIAESPLFRFLGNGVTVGRRRQRAGVAGLLPRCAVRLRRADRPSVGGSRRITCPAATRPPSSSVGTTATPTTATWCSTCRMRPQFVMAAG